MSRIELTDTGKDMLLKLAEGNPGAITALVNTVRTAKVVDPTAFCGNGDIAMLLNLDEYEIYGSRIWMLYKDVCKYNALHFVASLRAVQLGIITREQLNHAIDHHGEGLDLDAILIAVKAQLSKFDVKDNAEQDNNAGGNDASEI